MTSETEKLQRGVMDAIACLLNASLYKRASSRSNDEESDDEDEYVATKDDEDNDQKKNNNDQKNDSKNSLLLDGDDDSSLFKIVKSDSNGTEAPSPSPIKPIITSIESSKHLVAEVESEHAPKLLQQVLQVLLNQIMF